MKTTFETMTVVALFFIVTLSALWLLQSWTVSIDGSPVGLWAPALGLIVGMVLAIGLVVGSRFDAPRTIVLPEAASATRDISRAKPKAFTVKKGMRYRADISLGFLEQMASNDMIAGMLQKAGFSDVSVSGSGGARRAEATWPSKDTTADMPAQIVSAVEIGGGTTQVAAN